MCMLEQGSPDSSLTISAQSHWKTLKTLKEINYFPFFLSNRKRIPNQEHGAEGLHWSVLSWENNRSSPKQGVTSQKEMINSLFPAMWDSLLNF